MPTTVAITADDFERIAPVLGPCELVQGEIVRMSPGGFERSRITGRAFFLLESHNRRLNLGRVLTNEAGVVVRRHPDTVRGADVLFISFRRLPKSENWKGFLEQVPELVVEVLSDDDSWKRMDEKIADYHAFGVDMVWVLDPRTLAVRLYRRGAEPFVLHSADEIDGGELLPGFRCRVAEFFGD